MLLKTKSFLISVFLIASFLSPSLHADKKEDRANKVSESEDKEWQTMQSETNRAVHPRVKKTVPHPAPAAIAIDTTKGKIVMGKLHFVSNEDVPTPESEKLLKDLAALLNKKPELSLRIEGHSDSLGSDQKNMEMSQKRADRVKEILVKNGVAISRLEAVGLGSIYPVASDVTPEGQEKNRRVEFIMISTPTPTQAPETIPETQTTTPTPAESMPSSVPAVPQPAETQSITAPEAPITVPTYTPPAVPLTVPAVPETQPQPVVPPTITIPTPAPITNPPTPAPLIIVPNYSTNH